MSKLSVLKQDFLSQLNSTHQGIEGRQINLLDSIHPQLKEIKRITELNRLLGKWEVDSMNSSITLNKAMNINF